MGGDGEGNCAWLQAGARDLRLYGEDVYGAVIDEASRMKEDAWIAVQSTLTATIRCLRQVWLRWSGRCRNIASIRLRMRIDSFRNRAPLFTAPTT
jgi:hypothetical protein